MINMKKLGWAMILVPILTVVILFLINIQEPFICCWMGNQTVDFIFGMLGFFSIFAGIAILANLKPEREEVK